MEHQCRILCVVITSTDRVCSGGLNHLIHIWDLHSGETLRILSGHTLSVSSLSISNSSALCIPVSDWTFQNYSNSILASGGEDGKILIWNLASDELVCNFTHPVRNQTVAVVSLCLSKGQSTYLVSGGTCGTIALWKLSTQELIHTFEGHFGPVTSLVIYEYPNCSVEESFSRPSSVQDPLLISSSADWTIRIWNLTTTTVLNILEGHSGGVECLALYIPTQKRNYSSAYQSSEVKHSPLIVSGGRDETIRVWDLVSGALYRNLEDHSDTIYSLAVSTTDTKQMIISGITSMTIMNEMKPVIVSGGADCSLKLWNLDKIIADIHWDRRKNFGQFIYFLRHCGHIYFHANTSTSTANLEDLSQSVLEEDTSMNNSVVTAGRSTGDSVDRIYCMEYSSLINAFNMDDICYLIATYL